MNLPRWTAYPALGAVFVLAWLAIPHPLKKHPAPRSAAHERVVVLGIDGLDPEILAEAMQRFPERMGNFQRLADQNGIHSLGTSTPPQSPVAWSNFITGLNPGGHGIFDFIHRDPATRMPIASTTKSSDPTVLSLFGDWQLPLWGGDGGSNRSGEAFWTLLALRGIPADIWRMPANFPVVPSDGLSFSGMMTPAVDSAYGEFTFYTEVPVASEFAVGKKIRNVLPTSGGQIKTSLEGPASPFDKTPEPVRTPLTVSLDRENRAAAVELDGKVLVLEPGEWSEFVPVTFATAPAHLADVHGIVRFYLRSIEPFQLYASPINIDPEAPVAPVSEPLEASAELASRRTGIGPYYTQGMPEDVGALKAQVFSDREFMLQSGLVHAEGERMMEYALDRWLANERGGFLFFYFSTVDLCGHMLWRHGDELHPHHDPAFASTSSVEWTRREGSTWKDSIIDLYLAMDVVLGELSARLPADTTLIVMSDHGFAPYWRKFSLNTWLFENGYLVLKPGMDKEKPANAPDFEAVSILEAVDWSKTRAYGVGFNGLYLNLAGREGLGPHAKPGEQGIVTREQAPLLLAELKAKLEALRDPKDGAQVVLRCDLASEVYSGERARTGDGMPDMIVGYNSGYDNSDEATQGRIPHDVLADNLGGTFNGSHLMAPDVVMGTLLSNRKVLPGRHGLEDLTVEILARYGVAPSEGMGGHRVLESR